MPYRLKKNYFSKPAGTICNIYMRGKDWNIEDKKEKMYFAIFNETQKKEYLELIEPIKTI